MGGGDVMAWLKSHQELARHPKTNKFARIAGITAPTAIGHLHLLWWWAMDYAQDGDLTRYDAGDIADAMLWQGEPTLLIDALAEAGFLDRDEEKTIIHDWEMYAGKRLEQMAKDSERKKKPVGRAEAPRKASNGAPAEAPQKPPPQQQPKPEKPPTATKFKPPTVEEVAAYCAERKNGLDAEQFVAFYSAKNWMIGSNKMKDWRQAIITWEKRRKEDGRNAVDRRDTQPAHDPARMSGFKNALDGFDDEGSTT